jgi:hypothetical protein
VPAAEPELPVEEPEQGSQTGEQERPTEEPERASVSRIERMAERQAAV